MEGVMRSFCIWMGGHFAAGFTVVIAILTVAERAAAALLAHML
jgi:hypothetical protein